MEPKWEHVYRARAHAREALGDLNGASGDLRRAAEKVQTDQIP